MEVRARTCQLAIRPESCNDPPMSHNLKSARNFLRVSLRSISFSVFVRVITHTSDSLTSLADKSTNMLYRGGSCARKLALGTHRLGGKGFGERAALSDFM